MQHRHIRRPSRLTWMRIAGVGLACMGMLAIVLADLPRGGALATSEPPLFRAGQSHRVLLPGAVPRALGKARLLGHAERLGQLHLSIALGLPDPSAVAALIASQQDPTSLHYHQYLSPQTFTEQFGPSAQSVSAVRQFLEAAGLQVTSVSANRLLVGATGSQAAVEQAFGVRIGKFRLGTRTVFGPEQPPSLPNALAPFVLNVSGLDDLLQPQPLWDVYQRDSGPPVLWRPHAPATPILTPARPVPSATTTPIAGATPSAGSARVVGSSQPRSILNPSPVGGFSPTDLRTAYDVAPLLGAGATGTGEHVAVFELAPYIPGDISTFRTQYGLPSSTVNPISVDLGVTTGDAPGTSEADSDIEVVSAMAPNATQDVYVGPDPSLCVTYNPSDPNCNYNGPLDVFNRIVTDNQDQVITTSWTLCEPLSSISTLQTLDNTFSQAAAQGITTFAGTGDTGSDGCSRAFGAPSGLPPAVGSPASDQYVLGVGGTTLTLGAGSSYGSETAWSSTCSASNGQPAPCAGGGGLSSYFSQPSWQIGAGVNANGHNGSFPTGLREIPDVAAAADPHTGYSIYCTSLADCSLDAINSVGWTTVGGTSFGAPLWAGILTDVNTYLVAHGIKSVRWANATIYQLFDHLQAHTPYHDITSGTNDIDYGGTAYAGDYPATACYDLTTGVGSPDAWNIAQDLQAGVNTTTSGPCTAPATTYTDLVADGGFEQPSSTSPWSQYSFGGSSVLQQRPIVHAGKQAFFPCGYPACDDRVWQTITVPATVHSATLRYWLSSFSPLGSVSPSAPCLDHFYVTLAGLDGTVVSSIPAKCETEAVYGYTFETVDLTSLLQANVGRQLVIMLRGRTANEQGSPSGSTFWGVDDVSLLVS